MSIRGYLLAITSEQFQALFRSRDALPALLWRAERQAEFSDSLSLETDWHPLHFLLTGDPWHGAPPLAWAVLGGTPSGEELTYGPVRYLTPAEVVDVATALAALPATTLAGRYRPGAFQAAGINRMDSLDPTAPNAARLQYERDYWSQVYEELVTFYHEAASHGCAVLKYLS